MTYAQTLLASLLTLLTAVERMPQGLGQMRAANEAIDAIVAALRAMPPDDRRMLHRDLERLAGSSDEPIADTARRIRHLLA